MRSTAYSVMMTLLLLVPISAVPLMAIFGVPQFTPVVSSPLDESDGDDDEWDRPTRKKSRSVAQAEAGADQEIDLSDEESLDWSDAAEDRPRPLRKNRKSPRPVPLSRDADIEQSFAESTDGLDDSLPSRKGKTDSRGQRNDLIDEESSIQLVANEMPEDESPFAETAVHVEESATIASSEDSPKTRSYRRQKSGSRQDAGANHKQPASHKNRSAAPTEPLSWLQLSQRLNDYGIRNFRLESGEGEFSFTCTYTPSNSPHVTRKFEAVADDPLKAVAKVLAQVEDASQQKVMASPRRITESKKPRWVE